MPRTFPNKINKNSVNIKGKYGFPPLPTLSLTILAIRSEFGYYNDVIGEHELCQTFTF